MDRDNCLRLYDAKTVEGFDAILWGPKVKTFDPHEVDIAETRVRDASVPQHKRQEILYPMSTANVLCH